MRERSVPAHSLHRPPRRPPRIAWGPRFTAPALAAALPCGRSRRSSRRRGGERREESCDNATVTERNGGGRRADLRVQVRKVRGVREGAADHRPGTEKMPALRRKGAAGGGGGGGAHTGREQLGLQEVLLGRQPEEDHGPDDEADGGRSGRRHRPRLEGTDPLTGVTPSCPLPPGTPDRMPQTPGRPP